ncbi:DUF302 domain-containing protein [Breoghania sp.]|uniref:DUF302 domain-containing protein n=1 Tax=Breoghania sp. TaxID=2065378 RepID=UPI002AA6E6D1|nr:DUF302 domain-containing protein [Breoghania sp.]
MRILRFPVLAIVLMLTVAGSLTASAAPVWPNRHGWIIQPTPYSFDELTARLKRAIVDEEMNLVTQASASDGARMQGIEIPGNRVFGVFRNDFARRMLHASLAAGIEAPIRFYVTENPNGTATLAYKTPHMLFKPYFEDGGDELRELAEELNEIFKTITIRAIRPEGPDGQSEASPSAN